MKGAPLIELIEASSADERRALGWEKRSLAPGDVLFEEGDPADSLFVVADGRLSLRADGRELNRIERGGSLGESAVFFPHETRMGRIEALRQSRLFELPRARLIELREASPQWYERILEAALREGCERLEQMERRAGLQHAEAEEVEGGWPRASGKPGTPPADILAALRLLPGLHGTATDVIVDLFGAAVVRFVPAGHALFVEGDPGESMFLVASGSIDLFRGEARPMTALGRGSLLGLSSFVAVRKRLATAVAPEDAWLLEFGPDARRLTGLPGRVLREATLTALRLQLRGANRLFTRHASEAADLPALLGTAAHLEGWRAGDPLTGLRPEDLVAPVAVEPLDEDFGQLCRLIRGSVIGREAAIETPFGLRRMIYADYTASGRSLAFIEDFLRERVLPLYANTHTEASASGLQTTQLREEARESVARSIHAGGDDEIIFVGSGATGAINRLVDILGLRHARDASEIPEDQRPVVFIGPYEHHSNILPWRHSIADVVEVPVDGEGKLDLNALEHELGRHARRPLRIGSFSAASNVTGLATPVNEVAKLLHRHGALSFWDYAAAGPYVSIDMNPGEEGAYKDAIFLSPHKFAGGPGTPGILALKKNLVTSTVPTNPGGGTVDFVTASDSLYSSSIAHREESGTPAIIESIRCGLVFRLKDQAGPHRIHEMERRYVRAAIDSWTQNFKIRILGPLDAERISIVSFLIQHGRGYLHYNFVVALLNDLFGIQSRGGCSCAGPYGGRLFGLDERSGGAFLELARDGLSCYKPGWTRVNFNYFISEEEFRYIVDAVHLIATYGYALLPEYELDPATGIWSHRSGHGFVPASLTELDLTAGRAAWPRGVSELGDEVLHDQLAEGRRILEAATHSVPEPIEMPRLSPREARWRWFPLPGEQAAWLRHINGQAERPDPATGIFTEHS